MSSMHWGYKATRAQLDRPGTVLLARRGLICKTPHEASGAWADLVRDVEFGDSLHLYFTGDGGSTPEVGCFEVIDKTQHATPAAFGDRVDETAMFTVDESFVRKTDTEAVYRPDVLLGMYTGWIVRRTTAAAPYDARRFPGRAVLVPFDTAALAERKKARAAHSVTAARSSE